MWNTRNSYLPFPFHSFCTCSFLTSKSWKPTTPCPFPYHSFFLLLFFFIIIFFIIILHIFFLLLPQGLKPKKEGGRLVGFLERTISTLYSSQQGRSLSFTLCLSVEYIVFLFLFSLFNLYINSSVSPSLSLSLSLSLCSITFVAARYTHKQKRLILSYYLLNFSWIVSHRV